jgi:hypothetical protein
METGRKESVKVVLQVLLDVVLDTIYFIYSSVQGLESIVFLLKVSEVNS